MRSLGLNEHDPGVSSMGIQVSTSLAREISRYIQFHDLGKSSGGAVLLHALRPGDGCTVARALGTALKSTGTGEDEASPVRFNLEMFPARENSDITGSFLVDLVERSRTGASGIADSDRWMMESQSNTGGVTLPRLRWAKKNTSVPASPAHMAVAFDSFDTGVAFVPLESLPTAAPLHVYGLVSNSQRSFSFQPSAECRRRETSCWPRSIGSSDEAKPSDHGVRLSIRRPSERCVASLANATVGGAARNVANRS